MENKDFVTEQILSIEDFDNVDENLMRMISENEEYRRIFEEYKEISALASQSIPEPKKDGVTLHDAVMKRVQSGDVAPRYTNTNSGKFRFPIATVASLVVVIAAAIVINNGGFVKKASDVAIENAKVHESSAENNSSINVTDARFSVMSTYERDVADSEMEIVNDADYISDAVDDNVPANGETSVYTAEPYLQDMQDVNGAEETESAVTDESVSEGVMFARAPMATNDVHTQRTENEESDSAVCEDSISNTDTSGGKYETKKTAGGSKARSTLTACLDVISRMETAKIKGVAPESLITLEQILELGAQKYIAWFDDILNSEEFVKLYNYDAFVVYCKNLD